MIGYTLEPNELTGEPKKYRAQVVSSRSYTSDDIAKHLIKHNAGLSPAAVYEVLEAIKNSVAEIISDGGAISTELFHAKISIKGVFDGMDDGFDESRHEIRLNLRPGPLLRDIPKTLQVKKLNPSAKSRIFSVTDIKTGAVDSNLTPGKNIRILGQKVKIDGDDPVNGLYFFSAKNPERPVKVDPSEFVKNNPSEVIVVIPNLSRGTWNLKLVTQYTAGNKCRKTPHSIIYEKELIVT